MVSCYNCKPWQLYCHFSEMMCIVIIQLQILAVLWPLFWLFSHRQDFERAKTANGGNSMASFLSCEPKLLTVAVVWPIFWFVKILSQNCKPWQLYGHFSEFVKSGHTTARVCSSMYTYSRFFLKALKLQSLAFVWPLFWVWGSYCGDFRFNGGRCVATF